MHVKPVFLLKTVAAAITPEALGLATTRFYAVQFMGQKAEDTNNTGNVTIQIKDAAGNWKDYAVIAPGAAWEWNPPAQNPTGYFTAADFQIKAATNGDGVVAVLVQRA